MLLNSFLINIVGTGRDFFEHKPGLLDGKTHIASLYHYLMSQKGEFLGITMGDEVVQIYVSFTEEE